MTATQLTLLDPASDWCQRQRDRRVTYRNQHESGAAIDPRQYEVAEINSTSSRGWIRQHHYLQSMPPSKVRYGLYRGQELAGIATFGPGMPATLKTNFPDLERDECAELNRFGLLDDVPAMGESWFLARCFEHLRARGLLGVVSFSDPLPRLDLSTGECTMPGHVGIIYQASNAVYTGRSAAKWQFQFRDSPLVLHSRGIVKYRAGQSNSAYVERDLVAHGAPPRQIGESAADYLLHAIPTATVPFKHPGNHRYVFPIGGRRAGRVSPSQAYPKKLDRVA